MAASKDAIAAFPFANLLAANVLTDAEAKQLEERL